MTIETLNQKLAEIADKYRELQNDESCFEEPNWAAMMDAEPERIDEISEMMDNFIYRDFEGEKNALVNEHFTLQYEYLLDLMKEVNIYDSHKFSNGTSVYYQTSLGKVRFSDHSQLYDADINIGYTTLGSTQINDDGMELADATEYLTKKAAEYWAAEETEIEDYK